MKWPSHDQQKVHVMLNASKSGAISWAEHHSYVCAPDQQQKDTVLYSLHTHCQVAGKQRRATNNLFKKDERVNPFFFISSQKPASTWALPSTAAACPELPSARSLSSPHSTLPSPPGADYLSAATSELLVTSSSIRVLVGHLLSLQVSVKDLAVSKILLSEVLLMESCAWEHFRYCITVLTTRKPRYLEQSPHIPLVKATNSGSRYA